MASPSLMVSGFATGREIENYDQLNAIADILARDIESSRGIAVLLNPDTDKINDKAVDFPSFQPPAPMGFRSGTALLRLLPQAGNDLLVVSQRCGARPRPGRNGSATPLDARARHSGAIRTYASEADSAIACLKLTCPSIDRQFWRDPAVLRVLAVAVADSTMPDRSDDITALLSFMDDWAPVAGAPPTDGAAVPVRGLGAVAEMLEALVDRYPRSPAREVSEVLRDMEEANKTYVNDLNTGDPLTAYRQWRGRQQPKLARLRELLAPAVTVLSDTTEGKNS